MSSYLTRGGGSVSCCSTGPSGGGPGACSEARHHGWGGLGVWGGLGGVRQDRGHLRGHSLRNYPWGPTPWGPTRGNVGYMSWGEAARVGLHRHHGLGEGLWHHGRGSWWLLQSSLLLLFGLVVLNQLCVVLLLLPDLRTETGQERVSDLIHLPSTSHLCSESVNVVKNQLLVKWF